MSASTAPHFVSSEGIDHSKLQGGYDTVVKSDFKDDVPYTVELAERYLTEARGPKPSFRRLDRAAKKIVRIAYLQPDSNIDIIEYDEAVASNLVEPYDEDRQSDRIVMAGMMAQDIVDGRATYLGQTPGHPTE